MNGKQLKNSILQWAIQGKLVPQDPNDEPASMLLERIRVEKEKLIKEKKIKKDKNESIIYRGEDNSYYEKFIATGEVKCIDEEIPFEIPQGWEWERVGNIFETTSGATPLSRNPDYYKNGNINWVRTTDLNNGILDKTEIQITAKATTDYNLSVLPQTTVCIAMYGGAGTIGKHCILHFDTTINQSVCAIQPNGFCNMDYIHTFIEYQRSYWMNFAAGSRKDPNINQLIIKHCLLPIPPQEEQLRIVTKLNQLYPYINQYGTSQNKLNQINKEIWHSFKKSILQEAIQGKLVPQIAEEDTAQKLLELIKAEKLKFVKEGKLKKSALTDSVIYKGDDNKYFEKNGKTEQDITDEIPFEIPNNWEWCRIGSVLNIWSARRVHEKDWRTSGIPFYRAREISKMADCGHVDNDLFIEQSLYDEFSKSGVPQIGDLMMTAVGTLGKTYVVETKNPFYYKDGSVLCIGNPFRLNPYYLKLFFESFAFTNQYLSESDGTTVATLTMVRLNRYLIPIPPLMEQTRIVEKIKAVTSIMSR